jgi:hypothetical protein
MMQQVPTIFQKKKNFQLWEPLLNLQKELSAVPREK